MAAALDKGVVFRILLSILLVAGALALFFLNRTHNRNTSPPAEVRRDISAVVTEVDEQVDTILARFNIEKSWCKKQQFAIPGTSISRTERRVMIPPDVLPVQMNLAFNIMAKHYDGRAVASENIKENLVTIHIELERYVIQTIILKPVKDLKRQEAKGKGMRA